MANSGNNSQPFASSTANEVARPVADYSTSIWVDFFLSHPSSQPTEQKGNVWIEQKVEELIAEVKEMFRTETDLSKRLSLIYALQRLGISYHFEEEIDEALTRIHSDNIDIDVLHLVALRFRLLRQQGYNVPPDVFDKFKDDDGKFNQEWSCDAKGLLHLYEAALLATHEDDNLYEALEFARGHLEHYKVMNVEENFSTEIRHALKLPLRRRMRRLEAREYISLYDKDRDYNPLLLKLAKLDFNRVQLLHQAEIMTMSMWWKELALADNLTFARHRVAESYLWSMGVYFEPRYSEVRLLLGKLIFMMTVTDDIYDSYGTLDELRLLTDVFDRWDLQDVDHLPDYMRVYMDSFTNFIREVEVELTRKGCLHYKQYIIKLFKKYIAAYFEEAEWANRQYTPKLEEYLRVGLMTGGHPLMTCFFLCLTGEVTEDVLEWDSGMPKILEVSTIHARIKNDISSSKFEQSRLHVASSLQCYMNDAGVTELEAVEKLHEMVEDAWKDINKECLDPLLSEKLLNKLILSSNQMIEFMYAHEEDIFTHPGGRMKEVTALLLVHPIQD